jgi:hypothetical protein
MSDDAELEMIQKRIAYIDHLRGLHRFERLVGLGVILAGVALTIAGVYIKGFPHILVLASWALMAAGWVVFIYVIWKRTAWRRANPIETWRP